MIRVKPEVCRQGKYKVKHPLSRLRITAVSCFVSLSLSRPELGLCFCYDKNDKWAWVPKGIFHSSTMATKDRLHMGEKIGFHVKKRVHLQFVREDVEVLSGDSLLDVPE